MVIGPCNHPRPRGVTVQREFFLMTDNRQTQNLLRPLPLKARPEKNLIIFIYCLLRVFLRQW